MQKFFILEGGNLVIGFLIILITVFVSTRPFMSKGSLQRGLIWVSLVISIFVGAHFYITTDRMANVREAFENGGVIICESRMQRKVAQSVFIEKSNDWSMDGDNFVSPNYERPFHSARCIVK
jgi:hypothetical protein